MYQRQIDQSQADGLAKMLTFTDLQMTNMCMVFMPDAEWLTLETPPTSTNPTVSNLTRYRGSKGQYIATSHGHQFQALKNKGLDAQLMEIYGMDRLWVVKFLPQSTLCCLQRCKVCYCGLL